MSGKINDKRFKVLSNQYEQEQAELEQRITQLTADLDSYDDSTDRAEKFLELTRRYKEFSELTPTMLHEFVDRIEIHERADKRYKVTTQKVDIYLNFIGAYFPSILTDVAQEEPTLRTVRCYSPYLLRGHTLSLLERQTIQRGLTLVIHGVIHRIEDVLCGALCKGLSRCWFNAASSS